MLPCRSPGEKRPRAASFLVAVHWPFLLGKMMGSRPSEADTFVRSWTGIIGKVYERMKAVPNPFSNAANCYVVNEGSTYHSLCSRPGHLNVEGNQKQNLLGTGRCYGLFVVTRVARSLRHDLIWTRWPHRVFLVCNENSGHLLIVLPEGSLFFAVGALVAAVVVYFCDLPLRASLVAFHL